MPSKAYTEVLTKLLDDAKELDAAHTKLRTGAAGRQWGVGSLNRAAVVMCVSAWEAYIEKVLEEAIDALKPPATTLADWPALKTQTLSAIKQFNTPNSANTRWLLTKSLGIGDVTLKWSWRNRPSARAIAHLDAALTKRHQVAHGVNPRPVIHNGYAKTLPDFISRIASITDDTIREHLVHTLGLANPW